MIKRYFIDTEFLESPRQDTVHPISIGVVCEDGRTYYAICDDAPWDEIKRHAWLMENVVPHLPPCILHHGGHGHPEVKTRWRIAEDLLKFIEGDPEFWAWCGGHDYVVFTWLLGGMERKPPHFPFHFNDIAQYAEKLGVTRDQFPKQESGAHDALADAKWTYQVWEYLNGFEATSRSDKVLATIKAQVVTMRMHKPTAYLPPESSARELCRVCDEHWPCSTWHSALSAMEAEALWGE